MAEKIKLRDVARMSIRGAKINGENSPGVYRALFLSKAFASLSPYATIWLSAQLIGELAGGRDPSRLWMWVILTVVVTAVCGLVNACLTRWRAYKMGNVWDEAYKCYNKKLLALDFETATDPALRDKLSQIRQMQNWQSFGILQLIYSFDHLVGGVFTILGAVALCVTLFVQRVPASGGGLTVLNSPLFALAILAVLVLLALGSAYFGSLVDKIWMDHAEDAKRGNRAFSFFGWEPFDNRKRAADIRIYAQDKVFVSHFVKEADNFGKTSKALRGRGGLAAAVDGALSALLIGAVYLFVCLKAYGGAFGVGEVTQYVGALTALGGGISMLLHSCGVMVRNAPYLKNALDFLDTEGRMYQGSLTTEKRADRNYQVEFRDVSFKYPGSDDWSLRHVSIKFDVGRRLAVVGENGSGKTTFIKLLCRLYDPTEGEILLNGIDIRKYNYDDYMKIFSVVFQDFMLMSQPLGANVAGASSYDRERAEKSLRDAGFDERASRMSQGLDTYIYRDLDESGVEVSGGEAQKIAIARALYKDAPFIVLDEPTAALDPIAEAEIYERFGTIVGDRTAICISHRLSSCKFCDEITVFDHGQVAQQGSHESLLADEDGLYARLWNAQAQYYKEHEREAYERLV